MPTYPVTGTLTDLGLEDLGGLDAVVIASPNGIIPLVGGEVVAEAAEFPVAADGTFTLDLPATSDALTPNTRYELTVGWRNPDGYTAGAGYFNKKFAWFTVPRGGGRLVDFIQARVTADTIAVINGTDDEQLLNDLAKRGVTVVIDTSVTPVDFYRLEA